MGFYQDEFARLLERSGWSKAEAARELGLTPSVVSQYVKGRTNPSITVLRLFASRIGEPLLLPGETQDPGYIRDGARWLERWESDVIYALRRIPAESRERAALAIAELAECFRGGRRQPPKTADRHFDVREVVGVLKRAVDEEGRRQSTEAQEGTPNAEGLAPLAASQHSTSGGSSRASPRRGK